MTAIQRFAIHGTIMNPHSSGPYVRHEDHLAAMQGRCLAQIEEPAKPARIVLDDNWKARMLDGRAPERDEMGFGNHPELPWLDEGMMPRSFFAALGLELAHTSAEDQLDGDVLGAMSEAVNWSRWMPTAPKGDGWKLVSIFDTEDGPVAWWLRELPEAEDGTTTIRNLQAEVEQLKARIARAGAAPAAVAGAAEDAIALLGKYKRLCQDIKRGDSHHLGRIDAAISALAAPALEAPAAPAGDLALIVAALEHGQPQMAHYAEPCERHAKALAAARRMAAAPQAPAAPSGRLDDGMEMRCRKCGAQATIAFNSARIVTHNPHTGRRRDARDIASDPEGKLIVGPEQLHAAISAASAKAAPAAPAVDATSDTALLDAMERERIAVIPEFEGPWDAQIFGEDEATLACGSGATPRKAIAEALASLEARKAHDAAQAKEGGEAA